MAQKITEICIVCERDFRESVRMPDTRLRWGSYGFCGDCELDLLNYVALEFIKHKENKGK